jgi:hypothetical protein
VTNRHKVVSAANRSGRHGEQAPWRRTRSWTNAPWKLVSRIDGDFVGEGIWTLTPVGGGTRAVLEWQVEVRKPLVRHLTPLLRPLFAWNHRWAMARGQERIVALLRDVSR